MGKKTKKGERKVKNRDKSEGTKEEEKCKIKEKAGKRREREKKCD